ncbi:MAG TPA: hypothetical protein VJR69_16135 [Nitrospira sp.]|nr:hypothetical protein [Nitrospira sp.]
MYGDDYGLVRTMRFLYDTLGTAGRRERVSQSHMHHFFLKRFAPLVILFTLVNGVMAFGLDWVPTEEELANYRKSWNPPTHGTSFASNADVTRQGQWFVRAYVQGMIGSGESQKNPSSQPVAAPFSPDAVVPAVTLYYGLTRHVMAGIGVSAVYWSSNTPEPDGRTSGAGIGTTNLILKYRPIVQDPDSWKPSVAIYSRLSLPTNKWFGTPEIPGGFTPLSRVPSSRFGALAVTEGILVRKNLEPFRITGNVYYSYNFPGSGSEPGVTVYGGDLFSTHLSLEHVLNERTGFGYLLEMTTLQQFNSRLDGHAVNTTPATFWLVGIQPGLEYTFARYESGAKLVGAIGVMVTVAGQDDIRAIYPNISFKYFFEQN